MRVGDPRAGVKKRSHSLAGACPVSPLHRIRLCWPKERGRELKPDKYDRKQKRNYQTSYDLLIIPLGFTFRLVAVWMQHSATPQSTLKSSHKL